MSYSEIFLMSWAILSTVFALWVYERAKFYFRQHRRLSVLLAELAMGEITPKDAGDGFISVENDDMVMKFKRVKD